MEHENPINCQMSSKFQPQYFEFLRGLRCVTWIALRGLRHHLWRNASSGGETPQTERFYANPENFSRERNISYRNQKMLNQLFFLGKTVAIFANVKTAFLVFDQKSPIKNSGRKL